MKWIDAISEAVTFIEENITEDINVEKIANHINISPFYFQKGFTMLCGFTINEYIRNRRLALAGDELISSDIKIIELALKYGYESPDSFTKSFTRFHKSTPSAVRKNGATIKSFVPLSIKFTLNGGFSMDYKIIEKKEFKVIGLEKTFKYDDAMSVVPQFWQEFYEKGYNNKITSMYGINTDETMQGNEFSYMIADEYNEQIELDDNLTIKTIPSFTWAIFSCKGPMPFKLQETNRKIFSEWLPNAKDYEIAAGYCIEMYSDPANFKDGTNDEEYYSEIWIPIIKK
ncbi:AraC family transcriptional regulator [Bacilli bacterium PM5-9]|nr:AraC family transcriptional regulator [Bacilli bacterium PM5-9]